MKHFKSIASCLLTLFLLLGLLSGCTGPTKETQDEPDKSASDERITVTDMAGRSITLDKPAERVVALAPADCEILYAIGAGSTLVGRGEYCDYPEEVNEAPSVEAGSGMNIESVLALEPQVVLMPKMNQTVEQVETLETAGIHVVMIDANNLETVYDAIVLIGDVTGKTMEAEQLVSSMKEGFQKIQKRSGEAGRAEGESIYFEVSPLAEGLWAAGSGTFMDEIASMLGFRNAFQDVDGWKEISEEQVMERNPDYIVTVAMYFGEGPEPTEEIKSRAGWDELKAIQENHVFKLENDIMVRPGPRLLEAAKTLEELMIPGQDAAA